MDKTPVFFDKVPEKSLVQEGQKSVTIWTSSSEKRHVTVALTVAADGFILPPMINFEVKLIKLSKILKHLRVLLLLHKKKHGWMSPWCLSGLIKYGNHMQKKTKGIVFQQIVDGI